MNARRPVVSNRGLAATRPVTPIASPRTARCDLQMLAQLPDRHDCPLLAHADVHAATRKSALWGAESSR
jgi:hypothetical protein